MQLHLRRSADQPPDNARGGAALFQCRSESDRGSDADEHLEIDAGAGDRSRDAATEHHEHGRDPDGQERWNVDVASTDEESHHERQDPDGDHCAVMADGS